MNRCGDFQDASLDHVTFSIPHEIFLFSYLWISKKITCHLDREPGGVSLAGKVKNLFLITIAVYRLENRKMEVCRVSGGGRNPWGVRGPRERQVS